MTAAGARPSLVLSGSIGAGHDSVATACAHALAGAGAPAEVLDCMALLGSAGQHLGQAVFRRLLGRPALYDAFHFSHLRAGSPLAERMERASAVRLVPRLAEEVQRRRAGLLVSVFATGAGALGRLRPDQPDRRAVVVCTDATAHRLWAHEGVDRYVVCSAMAAGTIRQYLPFADVVRLPPPVRPAFFAAPGRSEARAALSLDPDAPTVLLMAGGWGLAPLAAAAQALARAGFGVLAVAGGNEALLGRLRAAAGDPTAKGTVVPFGFTDRVPELMAAADVVVTSPGQTCHEARVVRRPLVVLDAVPGHGRENLLLELDRGGALACTPRPASVVAAVTTVLDGAVGEAPPWPVERAEAWDAAFVAAVGDLLDEAAAPPRSAPPA